ncbi:MAG: hypothetical protein IKT03_05580 [Muribaculaceae bacterium]|nr:hypothetical protein [Muribaculaceae bacterium]MBR6489989.1 hypothetical protein [Muribaculaceae bacterium]
MNIRELMIGDWVDINGLPVQVFELAYNHNEKEMTIGILDPQGEIYSAFYGYDHIEPIPLTPEILEKNFSSTAYWYFIGTDKFCFRIDKYKDKWDLYFGRDGKGTNLRIKINYVHELQHALRLCGIDKEIEL